MLINSLPGNAMRVFVVAVAVFVAAVSGQGAEPRIVRPFESDGGFEPANRIDELVLSTLKERGIEPANLCSDEVFVRRVCLDVIGTLPETAVLRRFLLDRSPDKRAALIDRLLRREEFADYWALK